MKRIIAIALLLCLLLCGCSKNPTPTPTPSVHEQLKVHFIDVGQADCILLEFNKQFALIDGGNNADAETVISYLHLQGVQQLELVVATHSHEDHIGGLDDVIDAFSVGTLWSSPLSDTKSSRNLERSAGNQGKELLQPTVGQIFHLGQTSITVLGPVKEYTEENNQSIVLMVQFGTTRFLLTGDMERIAENDLVESGADLKADVLKVGHHGSENATGYIFLREVMPKYAIISCGKDNSYGHPHEDPLSRLRDAESIVLRTDECSTIVARSDGKDIYFMWGEDLSKAA